MLTSGIFGTVHRDRPTTSVSVEIAPGVIVQVARGADRLRRTPRASRTTDDTATTDEPDE